MRQGPRSAAAAIVFSSADFDFRFAFHTEHARDRGFGASPAPSSPFSRR